MSFTSVEQGARRLPKRVNNSIHAIGRRKRATARVYLTEGDGTFVVNGRPVEEFFSSFYEASDHLEKTLKVPFYVTGTVGKYNVKAGTQAETTADTTVNGVVSAFRHYEQGVEIRATDRKWLVPATDVSFTPDVDDRVTIGSTLYRIVRVREVQATDQAAVYELALRYDA